MPVQEIHDRCLTKSALIASFQMEKLIPPLEVIRVLNKAKVPFVLVGAYGLAGWLKEARATEDVDVVVAARLVKKAVKVLLAAFPHLEPIDLPVVVRLQDRATHVVAIDVMKPVQQPYLDVFHHTHAVVSGGQRYRVPSLEMALVMKFSAMTSLYRADENKHVDAHDFIRMIKQNPELDEAKLAELASLIYPDGAKDILEMVRKVRAGEKLTL
jgi:predicted nucleotidyltransferase